MSDHTFQSYNEIKNLYKRLVISFKSSNDSINTLKDFLSFYIKTENLLLSLLNEMFKISFYETIENRSQIFELLNKIMKIMIHIDNIRQKYPNVFCEYSLYKITFPNEIETMLTPLEDQRFSMLSIIPFPMGRLFFSLFATDKFEIFYPSALSKRSRIFLDNQRKKFLYIYCRLSEKYGYKYLSVFLVSLFKKIFGGSSFLFEKEIDEIYSVYIETINKQE